MTKIDEIIEPLFNYHMGKIDEIIVPVFHHPRPRGRSSRRAPRAGRPGRRTPRSSPTTSTSATPATARPRSPASAPPCPVGGPSKISIFFCKTFTQIEFCKFLAGSFSALSKRNFARKYAFDSFFQALQDLHTFAPLQPQNFSKKFGLKNQQFL